MPDHVRPQPPVLLPLQSDSAGVSLRWISGASSDITHYAVYRKETNTKEWKRIGVVQADTDTLLRFKDTAPEPGHTNIYTVVSVDDAGLESTPATPMAGGSAANALPDAVVWRKPIVIPEENKITLRWNDDRPSISQFRLFRAVDNGAPVLFRTLPGKDMEFTDVMKPGRHYSYRLMAVFDDGRKSRFSKAYSYQH